MKYAIIAAALIAGCASPKPAGYWTGSGTDQQYHAARAACLSQSGPVAQAAATTPVTGYDAAGNAFATNFAASQNAIAARGQNRAREEIFLSCMYGKGYRHVRPVIRQ